MPQEAAALQRWARLTGGKLGHRGETGIETLDGVPRPGEVQVVIGVESRMALHQHSVVGDGVGVSGAEGGKGIGSLGTGRGKGRGKETVTMTIEGYHHLEGIVILRLPGVDVEATWTVGEVGEGPETRGLAVHLAGTLDMIERAVDPDGHASGGIM